MIRFIRDSFTLKGECPLVYHTCNIIGLSSKGIKSLFPTGYMRGACLLAGLPGKYLFADSYCESGHELLKETGIMMHKKSYPVDADGFLINHDDWNESYAIRRAHTMGITGGLTEEHWDIIRFLRESYAKNGVVPTVCECCDAVQIELEELEILFPDGQSEWRRENRRIEDIEVI